MDGNGTAVRCRRPFHWTGTELTMHRGKGMHMVCDQWVYSLSPPFCVLDHEPGGQAGDELHEVRDVTCEYRRGDGVQMKSELLP
jgi:hypothetical protein